MRCAELRRALERSADRLIEDYANASDRRGGAANDDCDPARFASWVKQVVVQGNSAGATTASTRSLPHPAPMMKAAALALQLVAGWPEAQAEEAAAWELVFVEAEAANRRDGD